MLVVPIVTAKQIESLRPGKRVLLPVVGWVVTCAAGFFLAATIDMSLIVAADDWPQINGPNRNGIAVDETLQKEWPNEGLIEIWTHPVGQGFAGPVVVGETLIIFHRPGKKYLVEALNSKTGRLIWNKELAADDMSPGDEAGPKSSPLIYGDHVYLLGVGGNLYCLKLTDGEVVWEKNVLREYKSPPGYFGAGSTPIVVAENLLLNVGGQNAAVVAFDLKTGQEKWKAFDDRASYSSPIEFSVQGQSVAVFITRLHLLGLKPETGEVLFEMPFGKRGPTVNGAMPVQIADHLFLTAAYGVGAQWLELSLGNVAKIWGNDDSFSSQYSTPVVVDGMLFGTAGRQDIGNGSYRCVDSATGKVKWKREGVPVGHSILVGNQILILDSDGGFHVINADANKFIRNYQSILFETPSFAMPALADGRFYARSNAVRGKGELVCVEVGPHKK